MEDSISLLLHILSPPNLRPVALHLLTEKEKKDLVQLVNTMVSYSITCKSLKSNPVSSKPRHEVVPDASVLTFDPPLGDLVHFKDYRSSHFVLALAMKQVLLHEVEKQKILQAGINRSMHLTDVAKENQTLEDKNGISQSSTSHYASAKKMVDVPNPSKFRECEIAAPPASSKFSSSKNSAVATKLKSNRKYKEAFEREL